MKRRDVILVGGLIALATGWQQFGVRRAQISWQPIADLPGWRLGTAGQISGAVDPFLAALPDQQAVPPVPPSDIETAVFRGTGARIAVFSDHFCPYCRVLFARLAGSRRTIEWHELPLLRPESHVAARAAEAARLQGGYEVFQSALIAQGFRPAPAWLARVAETAGLDGARLRHDMAGAEVARGLRRSAGAAVRLGIFATPGTVIGTSVVLGAIREDAFEALVSEI